jgi:hypothetical protein
LIVLFRFCLLCPPQPPNKSLTFKKSESRAGKNIFAPSFRFEDMGIGGLDKQFGDIFRRAFASRTFPASLTKKLGIHHVKGILLCVFFYSVVRGTCIVFTFAPSVFSFFAASLLPGMVRRALARP